MERLVKIHDHYNSGHIQNEAGLEWEKAIGYLASWSISTDTYPFVDLFISHSLMEITAVYRREKDGNVKYTIGAIWDPDTKRFSFHS